MNNTDYLILLVDDQIDNLHYLEELLHNETYTTLTATSALATSQILDQKTPDLIILDTCLPDLDGFQICQQIKENPQTKQIKVLFMSTHNNLEEKTQCFECGGVDYISRPFIDKEVLIKVKNHLELIEAQRFATSREEYETIVNNSMDAIFLIDIIDGQFIYKRLNPMEEKLTGITTKEARGKTPEQLVGSELGSKFAARYKSCLEQRQVITYEEEQQLPSGTKTYNTKLSPVFQNGKVTQLVGFSRDITNQKLEAEKIRYISYHDTLTGLYNRAYYEEFLNKINAQDQLPVSIIIGDVNGLKIANDIFGHEIGDKLLIEIANIIKNSVRQDDVVARWGGDEFGIILPQTSAERANAIIQLIEKHCSNSTLDPIPPHIALGYATKRWHQQNIETICKEAENKMYQKKEKQKSGFTNPLLQHIISKMESTEFIQLNHTPAIIQYTSQFIKHLALSKKDQEALLLLSKIHDIGKMGVSKKIILKTEKLTPSELVEYKSHVELGYTIINSFKHLGEVANAILHHHERWDGQGYPNGLKGTDIPYLSRIIRIVDIYDSISSKQWYYIDNDITLEGTVDHQKALRFIQDMAGSILDPELVDVFIKTMV